MGYLKMWSTAFQVTNKNKTGLLIFVLFFCISCNNNVEEFKSRCQGGSDEFPLSNEIYKQLKKHPFDRYIAIKTGSDRSGSYNFYFLGKTAKSGIFIHANAASLTTGSIALAETKKAFLLLPENFDLLQNYIDSSETMSHLICGYMKINIDGKIRSVSFYNYIFETALEEPVSQRGVATMEHIKNYFRNTLLKNNPPEVFNKKTIDVSSIPQLSEKEIKKLMKRINNDPVFYEVP